MRMKNLTLGYSLPKSVLKTIGFNTTRIYTSLENFFTWDNLGRLPLDPEEIAGVDGAGYASNAQLGVKAPMFKTVSFGLQLNF